MSWAMMIGDKGGKVRFALDLQEEFVTLDKLLRLCIKKECDSFCSALDFS